MSNVNVKKDRLVSRIKNSNFWNELIALINRSLVGIDISDHSIEVVQLNKRGRIIACSRSTLDDGIIENGVIKKQKVLIDTLKKTLKESKPHSLSLEEGREIKVITSLPEAKVYTYQFSFKSNENLYQKIQENIQKTIPIPIENLYWDFVKSEPSKDEASVFCVAVEKETVENYIYFFKITGVVPIIFDTESASMARAFIGENQKENTLILDIGASKTILGIYNKNGSMSVAVSVNIGGSTFTQKIKEKLNISKEEAEEKKIKEGFKSDTEVSRILKEELKELIQETKRAIYFYKEESQEIVNKIILAGGSALLPDIDKYFQESFDNIKVEIGDPFSKIEHPSDFTIEKRVLFSNVIGLAIRGMKSNNYEKGINLLPEELKSKERQFQRDQKKLFFIAKILSIVLGVFVLGLLIYYIIFMPVPPIVQNILDFLKNLVPFLTFN